MYDHQNLNDTIWCHWHCGLVKVMTPYGVIGSRGVKKYPGDNNCMSHEMYNLFLVCITFSSKTKKKKCIKKIVQLCKNNFGSFTFSLAIYAKTDFMIQIEKKHKY